MSFKDKKIFSSIMITISVKIFDGLKLVFHVIFRPIISPDLKCSREPQGQIAKHAPLNLHDLKQNILKFKKS